MKRTCAVMVIALVMLLSLTTGGVLAAKTTTADVVIVGAGGAGLAAAVQAASQGAKVIVLEKMPYVGGSSAMCGGQLSFAGTDFQKANNVEDSTALFFDDMMKVGKNINDPKLVQAYMDNQLDTYYWLKDMGVKFLALNAYAGMSVPRAHTVNPADTIKILSQKAKDKGAQIYLNTAAQRLVQDSKGKVVGVIAKQGKETVTFQARKGVILASGGFIFNKQLLAQFVPAMTQASVSGGLGNTGDGLKMAWALGAGIADMPYIKATFGVHPESKSFNAYAANFYKGAIIVNKNGQRFVDESISYKLLADAAFQQPQGVGYQIFDSTMLGGEWPGNKAQDYEAKGWLFKANTIRELAEKAGLPADALEATVKRYNGFVDQGRDADFGRTSLTSGYGKMLKIQTPPFYAYPSTGMLIGTYGGITINPKAQVLNVFGEVIPGLYAAGEITGGMHGGAYMTGTAFGKAIIFGRIAAKSALQ